MFSSQYVCLVQQIVRHLQSIRNDDLYVCFKVFCYFRLFGKQNKYTSNFSSNTMYMSTSFGTKTKETHTHTRIYTRARTHTYARTHAHTHTHTHTDKLTLINHYEPANFRPWSALSEMSHSSCHVVFLFFRIRSILKLKFRQSNPVLTHITFFIA